MTFDRTTIRIVTVSLAVLAVASLAGIVFLSATSHPIPDVLQNVVIGAMSALAALLASTKSEPLAVTAPEDKPLPVVEQDAGARTETVKPKRSRTRDAGQVDMALLVFAVNAATLVLVCLIAHKVHVW